MQSKSMSLPTMESLTTELSSSIPFKSDKSFLTTSNIKNHPSSPSSACAAVSTPVRVDPLPQTRMPDMSTRVGCRAEMGKEVHQSSLPQKHEMLCEFFNAMVSSIRLLRLKRLPSSLAKLSRSIESLTDRRFTLHHLAQLKHIVPELIVVEKIRVKDEETSCMKEELLISLEADAVETETHAKGSNGYSHLKWIFRTRMADYTTAHPGGEDVPKGELPELFYKPKYEPESSMNQTHFLQPTTLTQPSFKRRFSSRALTSLVSEPSVDKPLPETPIKEPPSALINDMYSRPTTYTDATPVKGASTSAKSGSSPAQCISTPAKYASTPARLMAATPTLHPLKRSLTTDNDATDLPNKSAKRRSLKFDDEIHDVEVHDDLLEVLPENLLHSLMDKERRTLEEQDPAVSQACKRQQLMAGVPKLLDMVQLLFQSVRRSVMTKEELIHKVIAGHLDIVDKGEVKEQLELLQEVTPGFITELSCLSGDTLLRLNKSSCVGSIRSKLLKA